MKRATFDDVGVEELESRLMELELCFVDVKDQNETLDSENADLTGENVRLEDEVSDLRLQLSDIHEITNDLIDDLEPAFFSEWRALFLWNESFSDADLIDA